MTLPVLVVILTFYQRQIFIYAVYPIGLTWKYKQNENLINKKETHTHSEISEIERK